MGATAADIDIVVGRPNKEDVQKEQRINFKKQEAEEAKNEGSLAHLARIGFTPHDSCPPPIPNDAVPLYTDAVEYLAFYKFDVFGKPWHATWSKLPEYGFPQLEVSVKGHEEAGGHTLWY